jgi:hypothetical protein
MNHVQPHRQVLKADAVPFICDMGTVYRTPGRNCPHLELSGREGANGPLQRGSVDDCRFRTPTVEDVLGEAFIDVPLQGRPWSLRRILQDCAHE